MASRVAREARNQQPSQGGQRQEQHSPLTGKLRQGSREHSGHLGPGLCRWLDWQAGVCKGTHSPHRRWVPRALSGEGAIRASGPSAGALPFPPALLRDLLSCATLRMPSSPPQTARSCGAGEVAGEGLADMVLAEPVLWGPCCLVPPLP